MPDKVTVIIPTYNRSDSILRTLKSIINQSYRPLDIVIIDDGSQDNTKDVLQPYLAGGDNCTIRYFYQENAGVSAARNYGIKMARGEYISFCDSDDILLPGKIEKQVHYMKQEGADVSYGQVRYKSDTGEYLNHPEPASDDPALQFLFYKTLSQNDSWMFSRELFTEHNLSFRVGCSWGEDNEFLVKALFWAKKAVYFDFCTAEITVGRDDGLSRFSWEKAGRDVYIYEQIRSWLESHAPSEFRRKRYLNTINYYTIPAQVINRVWAGRQDKTGARDTLAQYSAYTSFWNVLRRPLCISKFKMLVKIVLLKVYLH